MTLIVALLLPLAAGCGSDDSGDGSSSSSSSKPKQADLASAPADCEAGDAAPAAGNATEATRDDLVGKTFRFIEVNGCDVPDDIDRSMTFTADGWSGFLTCNSMNGTWELEEGTLTLGEGASTLMACAAEDVDIAASELKRVDVTEGGGLVFTDDDDDVVAITAPPEDAE